MRHFYEQMSPVGAWMPVIAADAPSEKKAEGRRLKFRNHRPVSPVLAQHCNLGKIAWMVESGFRPTHVCAETGAAFAIHNAGRLLPVGDNLILLLDVERDDGSLWAMTTDDLAECGFIEIDGAPFGENA